MLGTRAPVTSQPAWPRGGGAGLPLGLQLVLLGVNRRFLLFGQGGVVRTGVRTKGERLTGSWGDLGAAMESSPVDFRRAKLFPICARGARTWRISPTGCSVHLTATYGVSWGPEDGKV